MTQEEIKLDCENQYEIIRNAEEQLKKLRAICKHENAFAGNYSYRVGATIPAIICSDCGSVIKTL